MHPIIVGIDPGTTSAFAALSFDFNVLKVKSKKSYSLAGLIYDVYKVGYPIIIATDKKEAPSFIKEFSQKTGSKIYCPKYDTKKGEKLYAVKEKKFLNFAKNTHEIDALASAIFAFRYYFPLIKKIKYFIEQNKKQELKDILLVKIITEEKNIQNALMEIEALAVKKEKKEIVSPIKRIFEKELNKEEKEIFLLKKTLDKLKSELSNLKKENEILKDKKIDINEKIKKIISFKEKRALFLIKENNLLRKKIKEKDLEINGLNDFIIKTKNSVLIKKLKNFSIKEYEAKKVLLKIEKDDILYVENLDVLSDNVLEDLKNKIKIIILDKKDKPLSTLNRFEKYFLILDKSKLNLEESKNFYLANKNEFEIVVNNVQLKKNKKDLLNEIIEDYRYERKKEFFKNN